MPRVSEETKLVTSGSFITYSTFNKGYKLFLVMGLRRDVIFRQIGCEDEKNPRYPMGLEYLPTIYHKIVSRSCR